MLHDSLQAADCMDAWWFVTSLVYLNFYDIFTEWKIILIIIIIAVCLPFCGSWFTVCPHCRVFRLFISLKFYVLCIHIRLLFTCILKTFVASLETKLFWCFNFLRLHSSFVVFFYVHWQSFGFCGIFLQLLHFFGQVGNNFLEYELTRSMTAFLVCISQQHNCMHCMFCIVFHPFVCCKQRLLRYCEGKGVLGSRFGRKDSLLAACQGERRRLLQRWQLLLTFVCLRNIFPLLCLALALFHRVTILTNTDVFSAYVH